MIISNKFVRARYGTNLKKLIPAKGSIDSIADLAGVPVFRGATVRTLILSITKPPGNASTLYCPPPGRKAFLAISSGSLPLSSYVKSEGYQIESLEKDGNNWSFGSQGAEKVMAKLCASGLTLGKWLSEPICYGVKSGLVDAFVIDRTTAQSLQIGSSKCRKIIRPYIVGREIRRYEPVEGSNYLIYTYHGADVAGCKMILNHLRRFRERLIARATKQAWYELQQPQERYVTLMSRPKIVYPDIAKECRFALDFGNHICGDTSFAIPLDDRALLGILNSRTALFYFRATCAALESHQESYMRFKLQYVERFPLPKKFDEFQGGAAGKSMRQLVDSMLSLHKSELAARTPHRKEVIRRQIESTDRRIDTLVYGLYGLTAEEIRLVELGTA